MGRGTRRRAGVSPPRDDPALGGHDEAPRDGASGSCLQLIHTAQTGKEEEPMPLRALSLLLGGTLALATIAFVVLRILKGGDSRAAEFDPETRDLVADLVAETLSSK